MDLSLISANLLTAPVLFFVLGIAASLLKSDLEIPQPIPRLLSLYLLIAIGYHGGAELASTGVSAQAALTLGVAVVLSLITPLWVYYIMRRKFPAPDAAAIAATYGSVSAVTFITATSFLQQQGQSYSGYMVAALALMESPAIIIGVMLARMGMAAPSASTVGHAANAAIAPSHAHGWRELGREALLNAAVLLLIGSVVIGLLTGEREWPKLKPFLHEPFRGMLCLFLLDLGLVAARRLRDMRQGGAHLVGWGLGLPLVHAALVIPLAKALGLSSGDALLLTVLAASASYIAVPAAVRLAIPQANASIYVPMSLGITFPFNVTLGIPLYYAVIQSWWGAAP